MSFCRIQHINDFSCNEESNVKEKMYVQDIHSGVGNRDEIGLSTLGI